jgi:hypothetical protein
MDEDALRWWWWTGVRDVNLKVARGDKAEDVLDQGRRHHLTAANTATTSAAEDENRGMTKSILALWPSCIEGNLLPGRLDFEAPQFAVEEARALWIPLLELLFCERVHNGRQLGLGRPGHDKLERLFARIIRSSALHPAATRRGPSQRPANEQSARKHTAAEQ